MTDERRLSTVLWRGKAIIAMTLVATLVVVAVGTAISPKVYRSTAVLQVGHGAVSKTGNESTLTAQQASQGLAKQYATLLKSRSFLKRLSGRVGKSADDLQSQLSAQAVPDTGLIELTLSGTSPAAASRLAGSTAAGFIDTLRADAQRQSDELQNQTQSQVRALSVRLRALGASDAPIVQAQRVSLRAAQAALTDQLASGVAQNITQGVSLAAPPAAEDSPASPRPLLNVIAGIVLGLLLGIGLAYLRARIEPSLKSAEDAEDVVRAPVLASIPLRRRFSPQDLVLGEAYEMLRANIAFLFTDGAGHVITFASYSSGEGKTSTVQGLAAAAQRGGKPLLVIDGDIRTRELSLRLGHASSPGLSSILSDRDARGSASIEAALDRAIVELAPGLSLLPAGPAATNAPALLDNASMRRLIDELRDRYPLILIDSPPSGRLADAGILASFSDAIVIVARVGLTRREDLLAAVLNLSHTRTPISGLVVLEPRSVDRRYFGGPLASSDAPKRTAVGHAG